SDMYRAYGRGTISAQLGAQELERADPGLARGILVVGAERVVLVGEGVPAARVEVERDVLAHRLQRLLEPAHVIGLEEVVVLGDVAVVQVGGQGGEALRRQKIAHPLDLWDEAPPLLDHEHPRPGALGGRRQVAARGAAIARELDCRHGRRSYPEPGIAIFPWSHDTTCSTLTFTATRLRMRMRAIASASSPVRA